MIADNPSTKKALMDSAPIRAVLDIARKVDIALLTAVDLSPKSRIMKYGVLSEEAFRSLVEAGAVGNICDYYLDRSEEHTSELQSLMRNSYAVFCLKKNKRR